MAVLVDSANKYRQAIGQLLTAYEELLGIDGEYGALNVGAGVSDSDFPDITQVQFTDGVFATQAVMSTITANKTNLYVASDGGQR